MSNDAVLWVVAESEASGRSRSKGGATANRSNPVGGDQRRRAAKPGGQRRQIGQPGRHDTQICAIGLATDPIERQWLLALTDSASHSRSRLRGQTKFCQLHLGIAE